MQGNEHQNECTNKYSSGVKCDIQQIWYAHSVLTLIKLLLSFCFISSGEECCIYKYKVMHKWLNVSSFNKMQLILNHVNIFVYKIVLHLKVFFHELFQNFKGRNLIYNCKGIEPFNFSINFMECATPISCKFQLVSCLYLLFFTFFEGICSLNVIK